MLSNLEHYRYNSRNLSTVTKGMLTPCILQRIIRTASYESYLSGKLDVLAAHHFYSWNAVKNIWHLGVSRLTLGTKAPTTSRLFPSLASAVIYFNAAILRCRAVIAVSLFWVKIFWALRNSPNPTKKLKIQGSKWSKYTGTILSIIARENNQALC